ncbi:MAG: Uncharacterised protein [Halieaceae bacterium]|nr:MAG: Uncharacterised protein [Halieaceae bacterium]
MQLLTRTETDVLEIDVLAKHIVPFDVVATQANHSLGQLNNPHRLAHVQYKDIASSTQRTHLQH